MNFWKNKNVLITGADGFIGSHLTEKLAELGANVRAFVYYNSFGRWGWLDETDDNLLKNIEIFSGDIRDSYRVLEAVKGRDYIFHLASLIAIPYSYHATESYIQTNIQGTLNVLNASRKNNVTRLIHTSTSEVYGTAQYAPIDEKHPLQGQSPYSASKIGADMLAESFYRSFNLPVSIARPFNTYLPRQSARAIIPTIISQLFQNKKELQLGALYPMRDFNFVEDTVSGFLAIGQSESAIGQVINLGSGREISIGDLIQLIFKVTGKEAAIVTVSDRLRPENSEVNRLLCNAELANKLTGWKSAYTLEEGLRITADWIQKHPQIFKYSIYNI